MKISFKYEIKNSQSFSSEDLIKTILKIRDIKNIEGFLKPKSPLDISLFDFNSSYKKSFEKVIQILKEAKEKNQMIVVYTDYDADGITGGAILWETLYLLGFKVMPYVPDRIKEGYGFSIKGIDNVIKQFNPSLIISVDHGITKIKEVEYLKQKKIKVIITDHHLKTEKIPKAEAIFHIPELSGSGVAYFFAKEIFNKFCNNRKDKTSEVKLTTNFKIDYLALASIGTIADLVPLVGPSRSIVKYGLEAFLKVKRYGIRQILKQAGIEGKKITPYDIGFIIAPRINAVGRLKHALDALRLLCTKDNEKAFNLAYQIGSLNTKRQDLVEKSVDEAKKIISSKNYKDKIIILASDNWHEGIIGLIASKIVEEFYRPTIVLTKTNSYYKGSARSIPSFHITNFLRSLKEYLVDVGGHAQASGFTIDKNKLNDFIKEAKVKASEKIADKDLERTITADIKIPISKINLSLVKSLERLEPFGIGNPQPVFLSEGIIIDAKIFGKKNEHLKIFLSDNNKYLDSRFCENDNTTLEIIAFNQGELFKSLSRGQKINVVYTLEIDRWGEKEKVRGKMNYSFFK